MTSQSKENSPSLQPSLNLGIVGHVDHGKTTLTKLLSGKWTDTHSEEIKRGITIKLGYSNFSIYQNPKTGEYTTKQENPNLKPVKRISIVDAPGHESFMATMISGAAVMDCSLLVIAANEPCPQPQTVEHLKTLNISGITNIIVIQNKIDMVTKEEAIENFHQIQTFLKGTVAQESPIIPISAQHGANIQEILRTIIEFLPEREKTSQTEPYLTVVRSFDINKPGDKYSQLKGGVLGGSIMKGTLKVGDEIEIKPGLLKTQGGKKFYQTLFAKVEGLRTDKDNLETAHPGGSIAIITKLDPNLTHNDALVGQVAGLAGTLPEPKEELTFENNLFDKVLSSSGEVEVKALVPNEPLMMIVNSMTTVGIISKTNPKKSTVNLKRPVMAFSGDRVVIFRRFEGNKWRIVGYGLVE